MGKLLITLIVLLIAGIGALFLMSGSDSEVTENIISQDVDDNVVKTFVMTGENFKFVMNGVDNPELKVKQGDNIRIEFKSIGGLHDWVLDEFNVARSEE